MFSIIFALIFIPTIAIISDIQKKYLMFEIIIVALFIQTLIILRQFNDFMNVRINLIGETDITFYNYFLKLKNHSFLLFVIVIAQV